MTQSTITIGYIREDGDVAVLATLNNIDELLDGDDFEQLIGSTCSVFKNHTGEDIRAWEREDAPHYLTGGALSALNAVTPSY